MLRFYTISLLLVVILTACKKEIDLNVPQATPKIVVEAVVTNDNASYVRLTRSKSIYENEELGFEPITDAQVVITDDTGNIFDFTYDSDGYYFNSLIYGISGTTYTLDILADDEHITGVDKMLLPVTINSVSFEEFGFGNGNEKRVYCHFNDEVTTEDFYLFKITDSRTVSSDQLFNGIEARVFMDRYFGEQGDEITIELLHINKENYKYFYTLGSIEHIDDGGPFASGIPGNPINTIEGNAIGFFGTFPVSYYSITIP